MSTQESAALIAQRKFLTTSLEAHFQEVCSTDNLPARLELFRQAATSVPAYRQFLEEHRIDPSSISEASDLHRLPPVNRENYLSRYSLPDLCRNGRLVDCDMIAVSSGSTGKPNFWPRNQSDELDIAWRFEQVFQDSFQASNRRSLAVICFSLGTWVGGMYTAACCQHLAAKGYPITVVTPGNNREEIFRIVTELAPLFDQTVLLGYPPFLKDVIDTGLVRGIPWPRYNIKLVTAGEVFSEEWRSLVGGRVGSANIARDSASLYGTADAGVLGNETPISIVIRRYLAVNPEAARELFRESRLPTLVQYDPRSRYFEVAENRLLFSGDNGIPLIRYDILDTGGLIGYEEMVNFLNARGFDPASAMQSLCRAAEGESEPPPVRKLPFVYVFGRSHFTVSYFGANIFPENITVGLEQEGIREWVTGKFVLQVVEDGEYNRRLTVTVELAPDVQPDEDRRARVEASIEQHLTRLNSEFAHYTPPEYRTPLIALKLAGDAHHFPAGVKHRYTKRDSS